jgi:hypothetical protein
MPKSWDVGTFVGGVRNTFFTSADVSEIRLMMDVLLEVYLGKLISVVPS